MCCERTTACASSLFSLFLSLLFSSFFPCGHDRVARQQQQQQQRGCAQTAGAGAAAQLAGRGDAQVERGEPLARVPAAVGLPHARLVRRGERALQPEPAVLPHAVRRDRRAHRARRRAALGRSRVRPRRRRRAPPRHHRHLAHQPHRARQLHPLPRLPPRHHPFVVPPSHTSSVLFCFWLSHTALHARTAQWSRWSSGSPRTCASALSASSSGFPVCCCLSSSSTVCVCVLFITVVHPPVCILHSVFKMPSENAQTIFSSTPLK